MCLAQGHNAVTLVRLEPAAPRSRVKHSTTEPLRSLSSSLSFLKIVTALKGHNSLPQWSELCPLRVVRYSMTMTVTLLKPVHSSLRTCATLMFFQVNFQLMHAHLKNDLTQDETYRYLVTRIKFQICMLITVCTFNYNAF